MKSTECPKFYILFGTFGANQGNELGTMSRILFSLHSKAYALGKQIQSFIRHTLVQAVQFHAEPHRTASKEYLPYLILQLQHRTGSAKPVQYLALMQVALPHIIFKLILQCVRTRNQ